MNKLIRRTWVGVFLSSWFLLTAITAWAGERELSVMITPVLGSFEVMHNGKKVTVQRNQNPQNRIADYLTLTSRECPPHCIQPIQMKGIETLGELEVLDYLKRIAESDQSVLLVDTRSPDHAAKGTIPGSVNVFGNQLIRETGANPITVEEILTELFGVTYSGDELNFRTAKTLVLFCYGIWCGQAPRTIEALIDLGYPREKIKWYRGGMQDWESVGLTTIRQ
jgi:rhodanese-related sulfurtransferase